MPGRVFDPQRYEQTYLANRRLRVSISGTAMQAIRPGHMLTRSARGSLLPSKRRPAERSGDGRLGCCRRLVKELGERNSDTGQLTRIDVQAGHSPVDLACLTARLPATGIHTQASPVASKIRPVVCRSRNAVCTRTASSKITPAAVSVRPVVVRSAERLTAASRRGGLRAAVGCPGKPRRNIPKSLSFGGTQEC